MYENIHKLYTYIVTKTICSFVSSLFLCFFILVYEKFAMNLWEKFKAPELNNTE